MPLSIGEFTRDRSRRFTLKSFIPARKFTQKSGMYSFGVLMYFMATGEPSFKNRQFDRDLVCDIMGGLRPSMHQRNLLSVNTDNRPDAETFCKYFNQVAWLNLLKNIASFTFFCTCSCLQASRRFESMTYTI